MTRGRKAAVRSDFLEADSVEDAIRKLKALKDERGSGAQPDAAPASAPKRRGRPPGTTEPSPGSERARFGVGQLTAHRPLGLLEVQDKSDLDALLADPKLAPQITLRLDDRFALVLPAQLERLQAALLKAGHTPRLSLQAPDQL